MQDRAKPLIATHDESLLKNIQDFGIEMLRQIRRIEVGKVRIKVQDSLDTYIHLCKERGNRIPKKVKHKDLPERQIEDMEKFVSFRDSFLMKEEAIDNLLYRSLCQLSATYILGLEKQIERLKPENDLAAIELINEEIAKTRSNEAHFPNLITTAYIPPVDPPDHKDEKHNNDEEKHKND